MYIVIFVSILSVFLTWLESNGRLRRGLKFGFIMLTILACLHYNYGNDYMSYYSLYQSLENVPWDFSGIMEGDYYKEPGWVILNKMFSYLGGFFVMVAVLNIVQNIIYYKFIKDNIDKEWWWMGMFIYAIGTSYYVINFSMMRQGFAATVFLGCWPLIKQKKISSSIIASVIMYLISFVHHSALLTLPFCFWSFLPIKNGKIWSIIYVMLLLLMYLSKNFLNAILEPLFATELAETYLSTYENSIQGFNGGLGFVLLMIPFVINMLYIYTTNNETKRSLVMLGAISTMIAPISMIVPMAGRMGTYFSTFLIAALPISYSAIKDKSLRISLLGLYVLITGYNYYKFFFIDPTWAEHYRVFHTIFEAL